MAEVLSTTSTKMIVAPIGSGAHAVRLEAELGWTAVDDGGVTDVDIPTSAAAGDLWRENDGAVRASSVERHVAKADDGRGT